MVGGRFGEACRRFVADVSYLSMYNEKMSSSWPHLVFLLLSRVRGKPIRRDSSGWNDESEFPSQTRHESFSFSSERSKQIEAFHDYGIWGSRSSNETIFLCYDHDPFLWSCPQLESGRCGVKRHEAATTPFVVSQRLPILACVFVGGDFSRFYPRSSFCVSWLHFISVVLLGVFVVQFCSSSWHELVVQKR